jgi:hypothetical protein
MAQRVTRQGIKREKGDVEEQNQGADSYSHVSVKKESVECVVPQKNEEDESCIQKVAMQVLKNEGKRSLSSVAVFAAFANRTGGRIKEESPVVSLSIVVARNPKAQGPNQNQERRRERPPAMMRVKQRRIKRRQIRPPLVIRPFEGPQSGINSECAEQNNNGQ